MVDTSIAHILDKAGLGIVELVWFTAAMEAFVPREGRDLFSVESVYFLPWKDAAAALEQWEADTDDPNYLDIIYKARAAAESLGVKGE